MKDSRFKKIGFLFDLDGVLIDSEGEYTKIWEEIEKEFPTGKENFALSIKGMTLDKILSDFFHDNKIRAEVTKMLYQLEKEMVYKYCSGAEEFIKCCITYAIPRAVVTSSNEDKMDHLYRDVPQFKEKFPVIIDSSYVKKSKPDPEGYIVASQTLGIPTRNCAVFEDSVQGVMAGKAAGAYVVGIRGTKTEEELSPYSDIIVDSLSDLNIENLSFILSER